MTKVMLIGTVHGDPNGSERLKKKLLEINPDVLSIESSTESLRVLENNNAEIRKRISEMKVRDVSEKIINLFSSIASRYDYESLVPKEYSETHNIPLYLSDFPEIKREGINKAFESLAELVKQLPPGMELPVPSQEDLTKKIEQVYNFGLALLEGRYSSKEVEGFLEPFRGNLIGQRDEYMGKGIIGIVQEQKYGILAHVGGFVHMIEDQKGQTLYSRIKKLNPQRILIHTS